MFKVAKDVSKKAVDGLMELVGRGLVINTDDFTAYLHLKRDGWGSQSHKSQRSRIHEEVCTPIPYGEVFQDLRHWPNTFRGICKKNLQLSVFMFQFNYNRINLNPTDKFIGLLRTIILTHLVTYKGEERKLLPLKTLR